MAKRYTRNEVAARLEATLQAGNAIMMAGAGIGISAKCAEIGGIDLIVIYNSGMFRMDGLPSMAGTLPFSNANDVVLELGERHVFPVVKETPVLAGVCATDPTRNMRRFLQQVGEAGFSGVINYPTVIHIEGKFRRNLESVGLGFARELEMIAMAREIGLYTTCYVATPEQSRQMAEAGVDLIVPHVGLTAGGTIGATQALTLEEASKVVQDMIDAAWAVNPSVIALAHGGPLEGPEEVAYVLEHTDVHGFVGASSFERLPVERAIIGVVKEFKKLRVRTKRASPR